MFCFRQRKLRNRRAEAELEPLQQDRVAYRALRPAPAEYPVAQDDLHTFSFAFHAPVELVEILKDLHCGPSRLLSIRPLVSLHLPLVECRHSFRVTSKMHAGSAACGRLVSTRRYFLERIFPTGFQPRLDERRRSWWVSKSRASNFEYEIRVLLLGCGPIAICRMCRQLSGRRSSLPDRRVIWQVLQPLGPQLFVNVALDGISMLIEGFQVTEDSQ